MIDLSDDAKLERFADLLAIKVAERLQSQPKFVGRDELSNITGLSKRTLDRMIADKKLPVVRQGRRVLLPLADAMAAIEANRN